MKRYIIFLILTITAGVTLAQIPRMQLEPWYQEMKANSKNVSYQVLEEDLPETSTSNVIAEMRDAYNNHYWQLVDSLYEVARQEVPDHMNMFNWERAALRKLVVDGDNAAEYMHRLMNIYQTRTEAGLPIDVPYQYGNSRQWNDEQQLVDYAQYAGRRIDRQSQYDYLTEGLSKLEKPLNAIVLCRLMDLTLADDMLTEDEFVSRYENLIGEAHTTRDWLNDNFLTLDIQTTSNMLQALDQREVQMRKDTRVQHAINLADEAAEEERLKNSSNKLERAQYYMLVATRHITNKEYEAAVEAIKTSLELNNDNAVAYIRLSECYTANGKVTGRVGGFLDKYCEQFAAVAAIDMLRENMHFVLGQQGRNALTTQIDYLRQYLNQHPIYRQDLFRVSMGYGDTVKLGSYIKRTITIRERY